MGLYDADFFTGQDNNSKVLSLVKKKFQAQQAKLFMSGG